MTHGIPIAVALVLLLPTAVAHVVILPGPGDSANDPTDLVSPPARAFGQLASPGGFHYYAINLEAGEHVRVRLFAQPDAYPENTFASEYHPSVIVGARGWPNEGPQHQFVTFPAGYGSQSHESFHNDTFADDRLPFRGLLRVSFELDANATGRYFLVVYSGEFGGNFALWAEPTKGSPIQDRVEIPFERPSAWAWAGIDVRWPSLAAIGVGAAAALAFAPRRKIIWASTSRRLAAAAAITFAAALGARTIVAVLDRDFVGTCRMLVPEAVGWALAAALAVRRPRSVVLAAIAAGALAIAAFATYAGWLLASVLLAVAAGATAWEARRAQA